MPERLPVAADEINVGGCQTGVSDGAQGGVAECATQIEVEATEAIYGAGFGAEAGEDFVAQGRWV